MPIIMPTLILLLVGLLTAGPVAGAQEVGKVAEVIGGVDILKGGRLPAQPAKVGDAISQGDIIRTKSSGKVQIHFQDDSVLTISPDSRVAINEYVYNPETSQRQAHLKIFHGLVHTLVNKVFKREAPDFTVETQTATIGVRGTDYYTLVAPALSDIYNNSGSTEVRNVFAEIPGKVVLKGREFTQVGRNLPPTLPLPISEEDINWIKRQMTPQMAAKTGGATGGSDPKLVSGAMTKGAGAGAGVGNVVLAANNPVQTNIIQNLQSAVYVPPQPAPQPVLGLTTPFNIVISWTSGARDLDLYLKDPQGVQYYYGNVGSQTGPIYYHYDSTNRSGGEVITVSQWDNSGVYTASVNDYTNRNNPQSTVLSNSSGVTMEFVRGGTVSIVPISSGGNKAIVTGGTPFAPLPSISPPSGQAGNTWTAVTINPAAGTITPVNTIGP